MNIKALTIGGVAIGAIALKLGPKILIALGIVAASSAWTAADVQDYVDATNNSEFIGYDVGSGYIVRNVEADGEVFVTNIDITSELLSRADEVAFIEETSMLLSCDDDSNQEILSKVEAYRDVYFVNGQHYHTVTTTIEDCK